MDNKFDNIVNTFFGQLIIFLSTCGNQQVSIPLNSDKQPEKHDVYRIEYQNIEKRYQTIDQMKTKIVCMYFVYVGYNDITIGVHH